jgi:hypothetical protein
MFGLVAPVVPISVVLHRRRIGSRHLRAATLVRGGVSLIVVLLAILAAYDSMWSNYVGPFGLDVPRRPELLSANAGDGFVAEAVVPLDLIVSLVWASAVGVYLTTTKRPLAIA